MTEFKLNYPLNRTKRITFLTGAGISAESGIMTFRGASGLWDKIDANKVATLEGFQNDPKAVWEWFDLRRTEIINTKPNRAHEVIAKLENNGFDVVVITQNIDNLHREAGSKNIIELHGNIWMVKCTRNCGVWEDRRAPLPEIPPVCACGSLLRPDVVWFGEMLNEMYLGQAYARLYQTDLCVVVGTSGTVYPAAIMPEIVKENGGYVVEVNTETTPISQYAHESHFGKAGNVLPMLFSGYLD